MKIRCNKAFKKTIVISKAIFLIFNQRSNFWNRYQFSPQDTKTNSVRTFLYYNELIINFNELEHFKLNIQRKFKENKYKNLFVNIK